MTVLRVAAVGEYIANDDIDLVKKGASVASQEVLLSSSDEGSGAVERFLHDKIDSVTGEGLGRIAEWDPSGVLALLDESGGDRHTGGHGTLLSEECLPSGDTDCVPQTELRHSSSCGTKRRVSSKVDVENLGGPPSKSALFDIGSLSNTRESSSPNLLGMPVARLSVPSTRQ